MAFGAIRFSFSNYLVWVGADCSADLDEFGDVEPSLAKLKLRDERLPLPDALAQFGLGDAGIFASLHKQLDYSTIEFRTK